jgi:hypothetical protein
MHARHVLIPIPQSDLMVDILEKRHQRDVPYQTFSRIDFSRRLQTSAQHEWHTHSWPHGHYGSVL